jgi:hypothetical protein
VNGPTTGDVRARPAAIGRGAAPSLGAASGRLGRWSHRNARWLFPAPAVLLVAAIIVYPVVYTVWMSLQDWFASSLTPRSSSSSRTTRKILFGDLRFRPRGGGPSPASENGRIMLLPTRSRIRVSA